MPALLNRVCLSGFHSKISKLNHKKNLNKSQSPEWSLLCAVNSFHIDGLQSLSPCVPYFVIPKLSLGLEMDHFPSFQTCFTRFARKTVDCVYIFRILPRRKLPRRIFDKRKQHLARWPSPGHQLLLCLTGSRNKSGNAIWNSLADKPWKISRPYEYLHSRVFKWVFCSKPCVPSTF